jgi:hypothetical protein
MIHFILGVHVTDRLREAAQVQKLLTEYGQNIKTRLGLHEINPEGLSPQGLLLLELVGDEAVCQGLAGKLGAVPGIEVQRMIFRHPSAS